MKYTTHVSALSAAMMVGHAGAAVIRHDVSPQAYSQLADPYHQVGTVWSGNTATGLGETGSGTLIAPHWVITAAHIIEGETSRFMLGDQAYAASEVFIHPRWDGRLFNGYDLALLRLDRPVRGVEPASYTTHHDAIGEVATFVGYGQGGNGLTGRSGGMRTISAGQNMLDSTGADFWMLLDESLLLADFDYVFPLDHQTFGSNVFDQTNIPIALSGNRHINRMGDKTPLPLEALPGIGDSGGGVFVEIDGKPVLIGTTSMTLSWDGSNNSSYTDMVGVVSLSSCAPWIEFTIPEPSTAALIGVASCLLAGRRRRPD